MYTHTRTLLIPGWFMCFKGSLFSVGEDIIADVPRSGLMGAEPEDAAKKEPQWGWILFLKKTWKGRREASTRAVLSWAITNSVRQTQSRNQARYQSSYNGSPLWQSDVTVTVLVTSEQITRKLSPSGKEKGQVDSFAFFPPNSIKQIYFSFFSWLNDLPHFSMRAVLENKPYSCVLVRGLIKKH